MFHRKAKRENKAKLEHKLYLARADPEPVFDLSECDLQNVPTGIYSLCNVFLKTHLNLQCNHLNSLAGGGRLKELSMLQVLSINNNVFTSLPEEIALLSNLKEFYISNNLIKKLPSQVCSLLKLKHLDVSNNLLQELPDMLGHLVNLRTLNITGNAMLKILPRSLGEAKHLTQIDLDVDNFQYPPPDVTINGTETILKFICNDSGFTYISPDVVDGDEKIKQVSSNLSDHSIKEAKHLQQFSDMNKYNEEIQKYELEWSNSLKVNKIKLLEDITEQQNKLDIQLDKIQQTKDAERLKLIEQIQGVEEKSDIVIKHLLSVSKEPQYQLLQQEIMESERLLNAANKYNESLCKHDVLKDMEELLNQEMLRFKEFEEFKTQNSKSVLEQETQTDSFLSKILDEKRNTNIELISKLGVDFQIQKVAVGALLERGDARTWSLVQQVKLVESQLATLTGIEIDRKKLQMNRHMNDLAEKRVNLSMVLLDLLEQQRIRRSELLSTLQHLENNNDDNEDFWLQQYQSLLDSMSGGLSGTKKYINPVLAEKLLVAGVMHCLPYLARISQDEDILINVTDEELEQCGIINSDDRRNILSTFRSYRKECMYSESNKCATAPPVSPKAGEASAPAIETTHGFLTAECVICMDNECHVIFVPCAHLCCCKNCASPLAECPMCRASIERKILIESA